MSSANFNSSLDPKFIPSIEEDFDFEKDYPSRDDMNKTMSRTLDDLHIHQPKKNKIGMLSPVAVRKSTFALEQKTNQIGRNQFSANDFVQVDTKNPNASWSVAASNWSVSPSKNIHQTDVNWGESCPSTTVDLMKTFVSAWNKSTNAFNGLKFNHQDFVQKLSVHSKLFQQKEVNSAIHYGFIQKQNLPEGAKVFVRADLHGDLVSLVTNLLTLQKEGLLDQNFKCTEKAYLVFLGDYSDRGLYCTQVLELLMALRTENRGKVFLIRGNHEDSSLNSAFGMSDANFMSVLNDPQGKNLLDAFYRTLPLTVYLGVGDKDRVDYAQFTHALFELHVDPLFMLEDPSNQAVMVVSKNLAFSNRVKKINVDDRMNLRSSQIIKLKKAFLSIEKLMQQQLSFRDSAFDNDTELTSYNWGDISDEAESSLGPLGKRQWELCGRDIMNYFYLCSSQKAKVKVLFRGHEHAFMHTFDHKNQVRVTTLTIGMDTPVYVNYGDQEDRAYILTTSTKMRDWQKQALLRAHGKETINLSEPVHIYSDKV